MFHFKSSMLYICLLLTFCSAYAQQSITIGKEYTLNAPSLAEERTIQVYLPSSYHDNTISAQHYPVIYLLDGESNFNYLTTFVDKLSKYPYPAIPEMIVVGIKNTNRTRDLTPTTPNPSDLNDAQRSKIQGESGGNEMFFQFIDQTLVPYVNDTYRTNGYNILIGHSFGGITALNYLLQHGNNFQSYIVHDPSIWWDNQWMLRQYKTNSTKVFDHKQLFLTQVGEKENNSNLKAHYQGIQDFNNLMTQTPFEGLKYTYKQYEDEDHGSIPLKGNLDGLRAVFEGYQFNFKTLDQDFALLEKHYAKVSKTLNFEFVPNEAYLKMLMAYFTKNGNIETANKISNYAQSFYFNHKK